MDAVAEKATKLGATLQRAPETEFYGDRDAYIITRRPRRTIASHVEDVSGEQLMERMAAMMNG